MLLKETKGMRLFPQITRKPCTLFQNSTEGKNSALIVVTFERSFMNLNEISKDYFVRISKVFELNRTVVFNLFQIAELLEHQ